MNKLYFAIFICSISTVHAQIGITTALPSSAGNLVTNVLLSPSGIVTGSVQNVTFTGTDGALGKFNGTSNLGFNGGIILCTDSAKLIADQASILLNGPGNSPGDSDLQALASGIVNDAAVLEFDFVPRTDTLRFRYVFGSEEYPEYVCSQFNDVFGFFITGPNPAGSNYNKFNIALVPGTLLPVSINSINPGIAGGSSGGGTCTGISQSLAYSSYYVNNSLDTVIVFDGLTTVLEAKIAVVPCFQYHIKIAVGNVTDHVLDSGVFLEEESFGGTDPVVCPIGINSLNDNLFAIAPNPFIDEIKLTAKNKFLKGDVLSILSPDGSEIEIMEINQITKEVNLSLKSLQPGFYFLRLISDNKISIQKIVHL